MNNYLTEKGLESILKEIYTNDEFIRDKTIPNSQTRYRPDFRCEKLKLIVEFDGDSHYKRALRIKKDSLKDQIYRGLGYRIVRIPYFVQIETLTIENLFGVNFKYPQKYPHGFIDKKATLPCDFCELGIRQFENDLKKFSYIKDDIIKSLKNKVKELDDVEIVLPKSLFYLLDFT